MKDNIQYIFKKVGLTFKFSTSLYLKLEQEVWAFDLLRDFSSFESRITVKLFSCSSSHQNDCNYIVVAHFNGCWRYVLSQLQVLLYYKYATKCVRRCFLILIVFSHVLCSVEFRNTLSVCLCFDWNVSVD